jgi:hypothetical protein
MAHQIVDSTELDQWRTSIESAWQKSVESVIEVGRLVKQAKEELGSSYALLETQLPFSSTVAAFLVKIAEHPVLSDSQYYSKLPNGYNTLYYLASVDEETLKEQLDKGEVTPDFTIASAKRLRDSSKDEVVRNNKGSSANSEQLAVGVINIAAPGNLAQFQQELDKLLKKYDGSLKVSAASGSLVEWHKNQLHEKAIDEIKKHESDLVDISLDQMRMLEDAAHYLTRPKNQSFKKEIEIKGKVVEKTALPEDYVHYKEIVALTGLEPVTWVNLKYWCIDNKIPNQFTELQSIDKPLYVWEQVRLATEGKDAKGARKRLKDLASYSTFPEIKELALSAYEELTRFDQQ